MTGKWMLDKSGEVVESTDLLEWARWFETSGEARVVAQTELTGDVSVSTIFLGLDHNFLGEGPPVLWETMVFGGSLDGEQERYSSRAEAEAGHERMVARAAAAQ